MLLASALGPIFGFSQSGSPDGDPVQWETTCAANGCLVQADILRGDSGDPPDKSDFHEYIGIEAAFDRRTRKAAYFAFRVDANAEREPGVLIGFAKAGKSGDSSEGLVRLDVSDCDDKSCVSRVPLGVVKKDGGSVNLLDKFLKEDRFVLQYSRGGKQYRTVLALPTFQREYRRLMATEFKK
ncbi:MAG: hypothetical protein WDO73_06195 [Ignavibacteriota bacterium]